MGEKCTCGFARGVVWGNGTWLCKDCGKPVETDDAVTALLDARREIKEHHRLHGELNAILHPNGDGPKSPSLCDLVAYVKNDRETAERERDAAISVNFAHEKQAEEITHWRDRAERAERERDAWRDAVAWVRHAYPESVFTPGGTSIDAQSADWARRVCDNIRQEAEERIRAAEEATDGE